MQWCLCWFSVDEIIRLIKGYKHSDQNIDGIFDNIAFLVNKEVLKKFGSEKTDLKVFTEFMNNDAI